MEGIREPGLCIHDVRRVLEIDLKWKRQEALVAHHNKELFDIVVGVGREIMARSFVDLCSRHVTYLICNPIYAVK